MVAESPLDRNYGNVINHQRHSYVNSMWEVVNTMTSVGFGDIYPHTRIGRAVSVCCSILGVIVVSFLVVIVNQTLS